MAQFTLDAAASLVGEGAPHAEFDNVAPDSVTLGRAGKWSDLTSEAAISSSNAELSAAPRLVARDIDLATEGSPAGMGIDQALTTVAAEAGVDVSQLWIIGDAEAVASLAGNATFAATNASDVGSYATAYGGARIYPTPTATADYLTVFWPGGFRAFATRMASGVVVDPTTGSVRFGQWLIYGVGQALSGANVTVSLGGS